MSCLVARQRAVALLTSKANGDSSDLVFVPLEPRMESRHGLVWRKTLPTRQAQVFLDTLQGLLDE